MILPSVNHKEVRARLLQREKLPTLPVTFTKIVRITGDPRSPVSELAEVIGTDPVLMASVLRAANSATMGNREPVEDLSTAILQLGIRAVGQIALSVGYFDIFSAKGSGEVGALKNVWLHSMTTALMSARLANQARFSFSAEAYVAGLLHDLGKLFFSTSFTPQYAVLRTIIASGECRSLELEEKVFGLNHQDVAVEICKHWHLPDSITEVACKHHRPLDASDAFRPLIGCVNIANTWAHLALTDEPLVDPQSLIDQGLQALLPYAEQPTALNREKLEPLLLAEVDRAKRFAGSM